MSMKSIEEKIALTELISAVVIIVTGVFLILSGVGVFPFGIGKCWLTALLCCLFVVLLVTVLIMRNRIAIALLWTVAFVLLVQIFVHIGFTYRVMYPLYVIALPFGLMNGMARTEYAATVFKICALWIVAGVALFLESTGTLGLGTVLSAIIVLFGVAALLRAALNLRKRNKEYNKENRR